MSNVGYKNVVDEWGEDWRSPDRRSSLFVNHPGIKKTIRQPTKVNSFRKRAGFFLGKIWKAALRTKINSDAGLVADSTHRIVSLRVPDQTSATDEIWTSWKSGTRGTSQPLLSGVARWAVRLWQRSVRLRARPPKLMLIEKITIGPRQSLSLIEAAGVRVLIATSAEGTPALFALSRVGGARAFDDSRRVVPPRSAHRYLATERRKFNQPDGRSIWKSRVSW